MQLVESIHLVHSLFHRWEGLLNRDGVAKIIGIVGLDWQIDSNDCEVVNVTPLKVHIEGPSTRSGGTSGSPYRRDSGTPRHLRDFGIEHM